MHMVFKVFMGLTTAPAIAFALDYLVHDAFSNSVTRLSVTVTNSSIWRTISALAASYRADQIR